MKRKKSIAVGCVGLAGLATVTAVALVALNRDAVFRRFTNVLEVQTERTRATLFRLGEVTSIRAELESEYGSDPHVTYGTDDGRILSIAFDDYRLPKDGTAGDHAREIAAFAVGKTEKFDEIDGVEVRFGTAAGGSETFRFTTAEVR